MTAIYRLIQRDLRYFMVSVCLSASPVFISIKLRRVINNVRQKETLKSFLIFTLWILWNDHLNDLFLFDLLILRILTQFFLKFEEIWSSAKRVIWSTEFLAKRQHKIKRGSHPIKWQNQHLLKEIERQVRQKKLFYYQIFQSLLLFRSYSSVQILFYYILIPNFK